MTNAQRELDPVAMPATEERHREWVTVDLDGEPRPNRVFRALDAVLTAPLAPRRRAGEYARALWSSDSSKYQRLAALLRWADLMAPGVLGCLRRLVYDTDRLPFASAPLTPMGFGSASTVFQLERPAGDRVLKVYRSSLGRDLDSLLRLVAWYAQKFRTISHWYQGSRGLTLPSLFLVLHGPIWGRPAVAVVQPYVEGQKDDFFQDFTDEALLRLMRADAHFRDEVLFFAERTLRVWAQERRCVDLLGRDNLMVVRTGNRCRLRLIDYGIFEYDRLKTRSPGTLSRIAAYMDRLQSLYAAAASDGTSHG